MEDGCLNSVVEEVEKGSVVEEVEKESVVEELKKCFMVKEEGGLVVEKVEKCSVVEEVSGDPVVEVLMKDIGELGSDSIVEEVSKFSVVVELKRWWRPNSGMQWSDFPNTPLKNSRGLSSRLSSLR